MAIKTAEQIRHRQRYLPANALPDPYKHPDYYARMISQHRLLVLRETQVTHLQHSDQEVADGVREYLRPVDSMRLNTLDFNEYDDILRRILSNTTVISVLRKASRRNGERPLFNKNRVFQLVGHLKIRNVIDYNNPDCSLRNIEHALEGRNRHYYSKMSIPLPEEVTSIIDDIIRKVITR